MAKRKTKRPVKLSRTAKPETLSLEDWQIGLRRQFGRDQKFGLKNLGAEPIFSTFAVSNPETGNTYRVTVRGRELGENHCTCPDFATNTLGTCKHVEFALARVEKRPGGKRALDEGFQQPYSEILLHYGAQRSVRFRPGATCPVEVARAAEQYFDDDGMLRPTAYGRLEQFLALAAENDHELVCGDDVLQFVAQVRDGEQRRRRLQKVFPQGTRSAAWKGLLKVDLYEYQRQGVLFAVGAGRALLGDEMGLGKTVQAVGSAELLAREFGVERVLIVCPTSLKHQWEREIGKFCDRTVTVVGGPLAERRRQFAADSFFKITNYDTVHNDVETIADWAPDLVILDEAQRIKNWKTRAARFVKKIASPYALVLTGTPIENRLEELVSIVQFVDLHRLGPTFRLLDTHQTRDATGKTVGYRRLDELARTLEPILLRRRKAEVLNQIPPRLEKNFFVPMTPVQMEHHNEHKEVAGRVVAKWRRMGFLSEGDQRRLTAALQCMRMACDSSYLLDPSSDHGTKSHEIATLLSEVLENPETKVVIFSQWLRMHDLLIERIAERGWDYVAFHGGLDGKQRKANVDRFREDPRCRLFLSTDAGGVGLNLQFATTVINVDLPWNPAVLEQRIGRVHRLGQTQPVQVYNFVAQGTIEEGMLGLLGFKKSLFAGVLDGGAAEVFMGKSRLNKFMESVEQVTESIPAAARTEEPTVDSDGTVATAGDDSETPVAAKSAARRTEDAGSDPLASLMQLGAAFLQQLTNGSTAEAKSPLAVKLVRDSDSGRPALQLPLPDEDTLERAFDAIRGLVAAFRK